MPTTTRRPRSAASKAAGKAAPATKRAAARPARKSTPAAKSAPPARTPAKAIGHAEAAAPAKPPKAKLVRDSFTMPKAEYQVIDELKQRGTKLSHPLKKSELLRAGIKALAALSDAGFLAIVRSVPPIKTGRPKDSKKPAEPAGAD